MNFHRSSILFSLLSLLPTPGIHAVEVYIPGRDGRGMALYGGSYALLIGASGYVNGWSKLPGVLDDLVSVRKVLEQQGFAVTEVRDPDHVGLRRAFDGFIARYGDAAENRLLFYFAGHGHTLEQRYGGEMGYIVPVDAPLPQRDRQGFREKALDMQQMEVYARRIQSHHALFLFDSCFSGSLFALSRGTPEHISYKVARPVRQFITSGSADETVPDESVFRAQFVAALNGEADTTGDGYVTGAELGMFLQDTVVNYSHGSQHPQYGKIRDPRLDKGDFVFQLAAGAAPAAGPVAPTSEARPAAEARAPMPNRPWHAGFWSWMVGQWQVIFSGIGTAIVVGVFGWAWKRRHSSADAAARMHTEQASPPPVSPPQAPPGPEPAEEPRPRQVKIKAGDRSVNIGGRAEGNTIITGDNNTVGKRHRDD